jgi:hypothetical protein
LIRFLTFYSDDALYAGSFVCSGACLDSMEFDLCTIQSVASHYADYASPATTTTTNPSPLPPPLLLLLVDLNYLLISHIIYYLID